LIPDGPSRPADGYHTAYALAGLSASQHYLNHPTSLRTALRDSFKDPFKEPEEKFPMLNGKIGGTGKIICDKDEGEETAKVRMREIFAWNLAWREDEKRRLIVGDADNELV
jgi:hypothetical protein